MIYCAMMCELAGEGSGKRKEGYSCMCEARRNNLSVQLATCVVGVCERVQLAATLSGSRIQVQSNSAVG